MSAVPAAVMRKRTTTLHVAIVAWLALISIVTVINQVALSNLDDPDEADASQARVAVLEGHLAELAEHVDAVRRQPAALPQARYETERQALSERIGTIEQALADRLAEIARGDAELRSLETRLARLEAGVATARPVPPAVTQPRASVPPGPPFRLVGIERRADERFVSIAPPGAGAAAQLRLLRPGEAEAGWRLETIEDDAAVFVHGDERRRLTLSPR